MRWLHRRREAAVPTEGEAAARKALHKADERMSQATGSNQAVSTVVSTLKRYGDHNNFADVIHKALGGT